MRRGLLKTLVLICIVFIISGAFNYGFSRFLFAIPFCILGCLISLSKLKSKALFILVFALSVLGLYVNYTLETNPYVFPIAKDGSITVQKEGYELELTDISWLNSVPSIDPASCPHCAEKKIRKVQKGETFPVLKVQVSHPDMGLKVTLVTPIGKFREYDLGPDNVTANKEIRNKFFSHVGDLMYYPIFPMAVIQYISYFVSHLFC